MRIYINYWLVILAVTLFSHGIFAQKTSNHGNKFEQLGTILPSPNQYRNMDGTAGPKYWQQQCDYDINCTLDTKNQRLDGSELITYRNNSPHTLRYLWLQLDENEHAPDAEKHRMEVSGIKPEMSEYDLRSLQGYEELDKFGCKIDKVTDGNDKPLKYMVNKTLMRIDLPEPLVSGASFQFKIDWHYYLIDRINSISWGRGGYEYFEKDKNYLYTVTQWYPRLCAFTDAEGWQNKQFTGRGEFALTFGNFVVKITVPDDHVVGATGTCQNYETVLTETQLQRWERAKKVKEPYEIVTLSEAKKLEKKKKSSNLQTWIFKADDVRDFAWTASRKFIWDAMPHVTEDGKQVMCMSYYPKEAYPIYSRYSTKAVAHTLETYSKFSIPYPYPTAISVEAMNGMEYPMICFNPGRAEDDGTYTEGARNAAITVIIHEVGHNYYPMIINSDERQWAWFDEGLNTFVQFIAEKEFDNNYPSGEGPAHLITGYMGSPKDQLEPIMTNSENIIGYFANAYQKTATGLNILRETIMGRELFDYAFKEYGRRWAFKHPTPADFFRTMEDASGVDLDWFWRGWFYSIDAVDISIDTIKYFRVDLENNPSAVPWSNEQKVEKPFEDISKIRNREAGIDFKIDKDTNLVDFYTHYKPWETEDSIQSLEAEFFAETYEPAEKQEKFGDNHYYEITFSNKGGLVMPIILEWEYEDGTKEIERIPVEIWRKNEDQFSKVFIKKQAVKGVVLDPYKETADIDESNNNWPVKEIPTRFQVFKKHKFTEPNLMQKSMNKKESKP